MQANPPVRTPEHWLASAALVSLVILLSMPVQASSASAAWAACGHPGPAFFMMHRPHADCMAVTPSSTIIEVNSQQQFSATMNVTWSANGGSIASDGTFSSSTAGTFTVKATSIENPSVTATATVTVSATPISDLYASPVLINFGGVTVGTNLTQTITLTNSGNATVTVSGATLDGAVFSLVNVNFPFTVAANTAASVTVSYTPTSTNGDSGGVSFTSDAVNSPAVVGLSGTGIAPPQHSVTLSWTAPGAPVVGYNIYRSTQTSGPFTKLNSSVNTPTGYTDLAVQAGATYYYQVTSVDSNSVESAPSSQVSATIPTP